ncbi:LYR family of Fe/S cluster biogenesis protein [Prunus dulcis]|uniref:LYR family of Fe/S cluster biogenesis protein n=2 Tax=Prunus dulcis TaxID=3755 RepID=A0A4Y1RWH0_PRUDU|nr:LYR family of Fe/S cluster biogenesis protein [Prunus dulcis]
MREMEYAKLTGRYVSNTRRTRAQYCPDTIHSNEEKEKEKLNKEEGGDSTQPVESTSSSLLVTEQIWCQTREDAMGVSRGPRLSGMQKQVLSLYRGFLRAARAKSAEDRQQIESLVSSEFRRNAKEVDRKNFLYIEYLLRRAKKQLDQLRSSDVVGLSALNVSFSQTKHPTN